MLHVDAVSGQESNDIPFPASISMMLRIFFTVIIRLLIGNYQSLACNFRDKIGVVIFITFPRTISGGSSLLYS